MKSAFSRSGSESSESHGITSQLLITKHQQIIIFSENIENLYTYIALMILLSDTLIICCLGFIIATVSIVAEGEPRCSRQTLGNNRVTSEKQLASKFFHMVWKSFALRSY